MEMTEKQKKLWRINLQVQSQMAIDIFEMARFMHDTYEKESINVGLNTQEQCKVEFDDLPEPNKQTMLRTCAALIQWFADKQ